MLQKADSARLGGEIIFQSELRKIVHLGVEDIVPEVMLNCTVANQGSFSWEWTTPSNSAIINTEMKQADLTRTSILVITNLSLEAGGEYACRALYSNKSLAYENTAIVVLELANGGLVL